MFEWWGSLTHPTTYVTVLEPKNLPSYQCYNVGALKLNLLVMLGCWGPKTHLTFTKVRVFEP